MVTHNRTNIKAEALRDIKYRTVAYGWIGYNNPLDYEDPNIKIVVFRSHGEFLEKLEKLDFEYSSGYGAPYVDGEIVFTDGTWIERAEYDDLEWWEFRAVPSIDDLPKEC